MVVAAFDQYGRPFPSTLAAERTLLQAGVFEVMVQLANPVLAVTVQLSPDKAEITPVGAVTVTRQLGGPKVLLPPGQLNRAATLMLVME